MIQIYTPETLFKRLGHITYGTGNCLYNLDYCASICDTVNEIIALKKEKNALILGHSYVSSDILASVVDISGDSFELSKKAKEAQEDTIVFVAVKFMAQTAKILNPTKTVLCPGKEPGCSLADSISETDMIALKKRYPNFTFVCYINTSAEVKAHCDVCVTSSNVYKIIAALPNNNIYFLPDKLMGENIHNYLIQNNIQKNFQYYHGTCYVHEEYDPAQIKATRMAHPEAAVLVHPECSADVVKQADFCGSTSQMIQFVKESDAEAYYMLTECGLASRLQIEHPEKKFVGSCSMCKYMKSNSLTSIKQALTAPEASMKIELDPDTICKAQQCLDTMFNYA